MDWSAAGCVSAGGRWSMPTYEYMCKKCGPFTQLRPMAECELPSACPECGTRAPRVLLTAPGRRKVRAQHRRIARPAAILARSCWMGEEVETCPEAETCPGESVSASLN